MTGTDRGTILHASAVALDGRAVLILGPSRAGKSALTLQLMAFGCQLVSDDRTIVSASDGVLVASCPETIRGRIEARGVGILASDTVPQAMVVMVADLSETETERLPAQRSFELAGCTVPLVRNVPSAHFPAAILQMLKGGRVA